MRTNNEFIFDRGAVKLLLLHFVLSIGINKMEHDVRILRIELGSCTGNELLPDLLLGNGLPVTSFGRHGIV